MKSRTALAALAIVFGAGVFATGATGQAAPKPERSAISKDCSAKADAQKLHGKERRAFRSKCKREASVKKG